MQQPDPLEPAARHAAGRDGDFDDLPDVPDAPDAPSGGGFDGPTGSDDDAVKQIRRRISAAGWLVILGVLGTAGGVGYYMLNSAIEESREEHETQSGRLELQRILQQTNLSAEQQAAEVRRVYSGTKSRSVRMAARRILAGLRDPQSVPLLIEGLDTSGESRAQAALGLAEIGSPAADAAKSRLLAVLPQTEPNRDRVQVAWALVVLNEPGAWTTVRQLLDEGKLQDVTGLNQRKLFDPALVARMAGRDRLIELANSSSVASKRFAALSLAELGTSDVIDPLTRLSRESDVSIAREAALGLGRTGDARAAEPILAFLNAHPNERDSVLTALGASAGASGLGVIIHGARDLQTRAMATRILREQKDPDAGDALFEALGAATAEDDVSKAMRRNAVFGLAEIGDARAVDGLVTYAQLGLDNPDPNSTQEAKLALEQIRRIPGAAARAKAALVAILQNPRSEFMRTPVIMALSRAEDPTVASAVGSFLANPESQDGAATALCSLRHSDCFSRVLPQVRQPANLHMAQETAQDEPVLISRRNAIRGVAWVGAPAPGQSPSLNTGRASIVRELKRIIEDATDRRSLREEAGYSLASVADDATLNDIAARATDTSVPEETRLYYIYALRGRSTPQISNRLVQTYLRRGTNPDVMKAAAIAAGFGGDDSTSDLLVPMLAGNDRQDDNLRFSAAIAVVLCGNARAANALLDLLITNDMLAGMLQNEFTPRSAMPNATVQPENWSLLPMTPAMFADGRIYRRVEVASILEQGRNNKHFGWALNQLTTRLKNGWESAMGIGAYQIRTLLREAALGSDRARQDMAFKALRALNDRGSLMALRRQTRAPAAAERARREILEMSSGSGGA
jgi:HEAT repeat protein